MDYAASLGMISTVAGLAGTCVLIWKWGVVRYKQTFGSRQELRQRLLLLACGETMDYVTQLFGTPTLQFEMPGKQIKRAYWLQHAWLTIVTLDENDPVVAFAITVTDEKFVVPLTNFTNGLIPASLGASRYTDAAVRPTGWRIIDAPHTVEYAEYFYYGNPGFLQTYVLSNNETGFGSIDIGSLDIDSLSQKVGREFGAADWISDADEEPPEPLRNFRSSSVPNTFAIMAPDCPEDLLRTWFPVGLHRDTVRMFPRQLSSRLFR